MNRSSKINTVDARRVRGKTSDQSGGDELERVEEDVRKQSTKKRVSDYMMYERTLL